MAKAASWTDTDAETRKAWGANRIRYPGSPRRKRCSLGAAGIDPCGAGANALSEPPGEYGRKVKTQRN